MDAFVLAALARWPAAYEVPAAKFCSDLGRLDGSVGNLAGFLAEGAAEAIACSVAWGRLHRFIEPIRKSAGERAAVCAVCRSQVRAIDLEISRLASVPNVSLFEAAVRMATMDGLARARAELADLAYGSGEMGPRELV